MTRHTATASPASIRAATLDDLESLLRLETTSFDSDRISRRSFRRFIGSERDLLLLLEVEGVAAGYILILMRRGTRLGRIYSVCTDPAYRGRGLAETLMNAGEQAAREHGCAWLRLEVRDSNSGAIALYQKLGYRKFGVISHYYEDDQDALRFEKRIRYFDSTDAAIEVPYYAQSTRFTCGPASLMMAMRALDPKTPMTQQEELRLWRESTTVFMTSGHGGCGPHGLALAAARRGFRSELWLNSSDTLFVDGVRSPEKQHVLAVVQQDYEQQLADAGIEPVMREPDIADLAALLAARRVPVTLISSWAMTGEKAPHWIVVAGIDDRFVYIHDPDIDDGETALDCQFLPIDHAGFLRMSRFGKAGLRSVVIVG